MRHNLIVFWADIAARHAIVRRIGDPDELVATIAGIPGAWGSGATPDEALGELHSVLIGWATLKVNDGDWDIPDMEGIRLGLERVSQRLTPASRTATILSQADISGDDWHNAAH